MKKILFVIPTMRMGGAEKSLVTLLNSIDKRDKEIDLLLFEKGGELMDELPKDINVLEADFMTRAMLLEFRFYFKELLKTQNVLAILARLIILVNSRLLFKFNKNFLFSWDIAKRFIKTVDKKYDVAVSCLEGAASFYVVDKTRAKKKISWVHTDISKQNRNFKREDGYYDAVDKIVTISDKCKEQFLKCYPQYKNKIDVIENMSNNDMILKKALEPVPKKFIRKGTTLLTIGRLEYVKGIDIAFKAACILKDRGREFCWHVFGDGSLKEDLLQQIASKNMEKYFILEGVTKNPYCFMNVADVIVQPSRQEGKSIVLDEAKILARPIVVTDYSSVRDQIRDGETGIIVDIIPEAIAEGIELLMDSTTERQRLIDNCKNLKMDSLEVLKKIETLFI